MILADTSVWIDHLRHGSARLSSALDRSLIVMHPFIVGEPACGSIANRREVLALLQNLASVPVATHAEVLMFVEARGLMGRGIGYVDAHLLASAALSAGTQLWTRDRRLALLAEQLGLADGGGI